MPDFSSKKRFKELEPDLGITTEMSREEIIDRLDSIRAGNEMAEMAFYAYRDLSVTDYEPFYDAAFNRNPVSIDGSKDMSDSELISHVTSMDNMSIYSEEGRLAQPDEVWNFMRGDGAEIAIMLGNIFAERYGKGKVSVEISGDEAIVSISDKEQFTFSSKKDLEISKYTI